MKLVLAACAVVGSSEMPSVVQTEQIKCESFYTNCLREPLPGYSKKRPLSVAQIEDFERCSERWIAQQ